jgi:predicted nucleic acid-binding protein
MRIYLDVCCFCRPFDDQSFDMIALESNAVLMILDRCAAVAGWSFCSSDALDDEIVRIPQVIKRQQVYNLYSLAAEHIELNAGILARVKELVVLNITPFDALHLASAEFGKVDVFLTADKKLINKAKCAGLKIRVENPLIWLMEVLNER